MKTKNKIDIRNKKASFNFILLDKFTAGIVLTGTEIKSIRESKVSFVDAFCIMLNGELWLKGLHIAEYSYGSYNNHEPKRDRKLLLNSKEIRKMSISIREKGLTIVPVRLFIGENGYAKVEIAIAKGKNTFDKRDTLRKKDAGREIERHLKH